MNCLKEISKRKFDALCYVRDDQSFDLMGEEIKWFQSSDRKLLANIIKDYQDQDYGYIILGRDERKVFRCIDVGRFFSTEKMAMEDLNTYIKRYIDDGKTIYPQGGKIYKTNEIFELKVPLNKAHKYFLALKEKESYEAARNLIKEIAYDFIDVDGNYIQQFQSTGFHSRLWELFLHVLFSKLKFRMKREHESPDFSISKYGENFFIEAVTVNPSKAKDFDITGEIEPEGIYQLSQDYLPIKFHNTLYDKVNRKNKYWEYPHVKGHPFLFAIHDYHITEGPNFGSMCWSKEGLCNYLYGIGSDKDGNARKFKTHTFKGVTRPSNFFAEKSHQYVSAIIFSSGATLSIFNRMGKLADLGGKGITMIRLGIKWDQITERPLLFVSNVDNKDYEEAWSDTVIMYHNPNAKIPVDPQLFPEITHVFFDLGTQNFLTIQNPNEVYTSITITIIPKNNISF